MPVALVKREVLTKIELLGLAVVVDGRDDLLFVAEGAVAAIVERDGGQHHLARKLFGPAIVELYPELRIARLADDALEFGGFGLEDDLDGVIGIERVDGQRCVG